MIVTLYGKYAGVFISLLPPIWSDSDQRARHADPQASLRAELLAQLLGAQAALIQQITALRGGEAEALADAAEAQLAELLAIQQRLASGTVSVAVLRAEVAADAVRTASSAARASVAAFLEDVYERGIFDPYLRFASAEEEAAYRAREMERRQAIERAIAEGTAEGDLRALYVADDQLTDARRFGAGDSPRFAAMKRDFEDRRSELKAAMAGQPSATQDTKSAQPATADAPPEDRPPAELDPEMLAAMRNLGVTVSSGLAIGHGVPRDMAVKSRKASGLT